MEELRRSAALWLRRNLKPHKLMALSDAISQCFPSPEDRQVLRTELTAAARGTRFPDCIVAKAALSVLEGRALSMFPNKSEVATALVRKVARDATLGRFVNQAVMGLLERGTADTSEAQLLRHRLEGAVDRLTEGISVSPGGRLKGPPGPKRLTTAELLGQSVPFVGQ